MAGTLRRSIRFKPCALLHFVRAGVYLGLDLIQGGRPEMVHLTRDQVIEICGRLDDMRIADIIATGATHAELMEARTWLASDDYLGGDLGRSASGKVARLVDLLRAEEADWGDR
jgi:hypothetical protein